VRLEINPRLIFVVSFLLIATALTPVSAFADQLTVLPYAAYTNPERGILFEDMVLFRNSNSPSLSQLKQAGFTLVGTYAEPWFDSWHWMTITNWMKSAHQLGLRTFLMVTDFTPDEDVALAKKAVSVGADVFMLDEVLARYGTTRDQLRSIIDAGQKAKARLQFIINEYRPADIQNAYDWTSDFPSVRIATDDYYNQATIDLGVQLGASHGKRPLAELIFSQGSQDFDCYLHLDSWISYAKQRNIDVLYSYVDAAGTWQTQWQKVIGS
jgi:hypothetical protein